MNATGERRTPASGGSVEERVQDLFHVFPYHYVKQLATPETRLLDVGFGEGYGAEILSGSVREYVGVDDSEHAVRHASSRYALPNVRFQKADGATLPFPSASFDLVISFHVLEHIAHPDPYLAEMARVCRVGGDIAIVTPNRTSRLAQGERPWNRFHVREFDGTDLEQLLAMHFANAVVKGITGSAAVTEVERRRVARARRLARLDPLGLRYRLPESLLVRARRVAAIAAGRLAPVKTTSDFSLADIRCVQTDVAKSVHLLGLIHRTDRDAAGV